MVKVLFLAVLMLPTAVNAQQGSFSGLHWSVLSSDEQRGIVFGYFAGFSRGHEIGQLRAGIHGSSEVRFPEKTDYYVGQLKSFYYLFPSCREAYFPFVLGMLALKWSNLSNWSYDQIAEKCGHVPPPGG